MEYTAEELTGPKESCQNGIMKAAGKFKQDVP